MERDVGQTAVNRIEAALRRFWARLGAALDSLAGNSSSGGVDLGRLVPLVERAIEDRLRHEGNRSVAPNLIDVRFEYETFAGLTEVQRAYLGRELKGNVIEYIHNRRYTPAGEIQLSLGYDMFLKRTRVRAAFAGEKTANILGESKPKTLPAKAVGVELRVRLTSSPGAAEMNARLKPGVPPVGLGRSRDNAFVIDDGSVSNFHASFTSTVDGAVLVADLASSNGTAVNGEALPAGEKRKVRSGDRLRCGDVEMTIDLGE